MIFQPRKDALYKLAITQGICTPDEIGAHLPLGSAVPKPRLEGWLHQLFRVPKTFSEQRRYVNQFKIGADPEFVFATGGVDDFGHPLPGARADAAVLGLQQGPAYGADNNGRLAEIRPHPSRSAVNVLASVLCTFRWMVLQIPGLLKYQWLSGAYLWDDGLGGHVHFGRKRPTRKEEIVALDSIEEGLLHLGAFPVEQVIRRRQGDARRQVYGALGDYRLQQHGYEYRTFPSWLDSPELAFITLVAAKLSVQMPALYRFRGASAEIERARLRNFFAYFKGVDDDARLALIVLDRGIPKQQAGSFMGRWGIEYATATVAAKKHVRIPIVPPSIKPDAKSVSEIFECLLSGKPLGFRVPEITWSPTAPPKGYEMCLLSCNTIQAKGLGEMIWDLCCSTKDQITFVNGHRGSAPFVLSKDLIERLPKDWRTRFKQRVQAADLRPKTISTPPEWRDAAHVGFMRRFLLKGYFPIWKVDECKEDSYQVWLEQAKESKTSGKYVGSIVYESAPVKALI
jgi:hypothetical protein